MLGVEFREEPYNERRDLADKVLTSSTKMHFIIDQSRPNVQGYVAAGGPKC